MFLSTGRLIYCDACIHTHTYIYIYIHVYMFMCGASCFSRWGWECREIEEWPLCHALIAFYSTGFPLSKAEEYVALRQPYAINDLSMQSHILDRRKVYKILVDNNIRVPPHIVCNRHDAAMGFPDAKFVEVRSKKQGASKNAQHKICVDT